MARDSVDKDVIKAFLGEGTEFSGLLSFEGTVRIDGKFEGEVTTSDNLIIGENAHVKAELNVGTVMIQGHVEGNIHAARKLQITSKGRVVGNVSSPTLQIDEGAVLEGSITMASHGADKVRPVIKKKGSGQANGALSAEASN